MRRAVKPKPRDLMSLSPAGAPCDVILVRARFDLRASRFVPSPISDSVDICGVSTFWFLCQHVCQMAASALKPQYIFLVASRHVVKPCVADAVREMSPPLAASAKYPRPCPLRLLPSMTLSPTFPTLRRGIGWQGFYTTRTVAGRRAVRCDAANA